MILLALLFLSMVGIMFTYAFFKILFTKNKKDVFYHD